VLEFLGCGAIEDLLVEVGETPETGVKFVGVRFAKTPFDELAGFSVTGLDFMGHGAAEWLVLGVGKAAELELAESSSLLSSEPKPS
jgi:hypothetical protein